MFNIKDNKIHAYRKRMMAQLYSKSHVLSSTTMQDSTNTILHGRLLPIIERCAETITPLDMYSHNQAYVVDVATAFLFGPDLASNCIEDLVHRAWYGQCWNEIAKARFWHEFPQLNKWAGFLGIYLVPRTAYERRLDLEKYNIAKCDQAEKNVSEEDSFITNNHSLFGRLRAGMRKWAGPSASSSRQPYPYRFDIAADMFDHTAAAYESSPITITYILYELSRRPELQEKLHEELLTLKYPPTSLKDDIDHSRLPDSRAIDSLPLLDAILQETLRRWPATGGGLPRVTPDTGCSLAGYDNIPPGVCVRASAHCLHRNPEVFPEPEEWRPERWLDASADELVEMRRWFWAWGSGPGMCLGQHFATYRKYQRLSSRAEAYRMFLVMKNLIVVLYVKYKSAIVDAPDMEQTDGFITGPKGKRLVLQWTHI